MRIRYQSISDGPAATENVVRVRTIDGVEEEVVVSDRQAHDSFLTVGEIHRTDDRVLVELPRESVSGRWRVWVSRDLVEA